MDKVISNAKYLKGEISIPGDKSISHRSVMIAALSIGNSEIEGFLHAADPLSTLSCISALGIKHSIHRNKLIIFGKGLFGLQKSNSLLDAGNSGTTLRLLAGILAGQKYSSSISGDQFLQKRPMKRIIDPLQEMGAIIRSSGTHNPPLTIIGTYPLKAIEYSLPIASAQVKSAILFAGLYADGQTKVIESEPSRDHTERMLQLTSTKIGGQNVISVTGGLRLEGKTFIVPGDPSSAAFFIVAGLIVPNSEIVISNVGLNPTRTGFLDVLKEMNANISIENNRIINGEPIADIIVKTSYLKSNIVLEGSQIPNLIDEIPILAVAAAFSNGSFSVRNAKDLRNKETDRIHAIMSNLRKMGISAEEFEDGFAFEAKNNLIPNEFDSFDDHRIAMAFGIASLALIGNSKIKNADCVSISFPNFWELFHKLQN